MLDPFTFFLWEKPRVLIDIRPMSAYKKGSLEHATSLPVDEKNSTHDFQYRFENIKTDQPLHLIDLDGKTSKRLSEGISLEFLEGGYKFFKAWREKAFNIGPPLRVLGGYTGSGKTSLLKQLKNRGHQIIDLEELASHKGSVFGGNQDVAQPLHEHFQNKLLSIWLSLDPNTPVWIEEKGPFLGKTGLPGSLYKKMQNATLIHLDVPFDIRLTYILQTYGSIEPSIFRYALRNLEQRMGMSNNHKALHYFDSGQKEKCFELILKYYDLAYEKRRKTHWSGEVIHVPYNIENFQIALDKLGSI